MTLNFHSKCPVTLTKNFHLKRGKTSIYNWRGVVPAPLLEPPVLGGGNYNVDAIITVVTHAPL